MIGKILAHSKKIDSGNHHDEHGIYKSTWKYIRFSDDFYQCLVMNLEFSKFVKIILDFRECKCGC